MERKAYIRFSQDPPFLNEPSRIPLKNIFSEQWDYLIVLDVCRYDYFKKFCNLSGNLEKVNSAGTHTVEWLLNNFQSYKKYDLIYVSANPQVSPPKLKEIFRARKKFFELVNVWNFGWDDKLGTVHPKEVNKAALRYFEKFPEKRMIIHFLQLHSPFIGENSLNLQEMKKEVSEFKNWFNLVKNGDIDAHDLIKAHIGNLKLVMKHIKELVSSLSGKIIISSDHGEAFGEYGIYSHVPGMYIKEIMEVPWFELKKS